jgi:hypothetical protein
MADVQPGTIAGIQAEQVSAELLRIREAGGVLTPPAVVEAARPPEAPLHRAFEWDDGRAAEQYRLTQARRLIRMVILIDPPSGRTVAQFHHVNVQAGGRRYEPIDFVVATPDLYEAATGELLSKIRGLQHRLRELEGWSAADPARQRQLRRAGKALQEASTALQEP